MERGENGGAGTRPPVFNLLVLLLVAVVCLLVYFRDRQTFDRKIAPPPTVQTEPTATPPAPESAPVPSVTGAEKKIPPMEDSRDFEVYQKERLHQEKNAGTPME